jgi:hypothetical protein
VIGNIYTGSTLSPIYSDLPAYNLHFLSKIKLTCPYPVNAIIWDLTEPDSAGGEQLGYACLYSLTEDICVGSMIVVTGDGESEHVLV